MLLSYVLADDLVKATLGSDEPALYMVDGGKAPWLELLIAGTIYIRFSEHDSQVTFDENIKKLLKHIHDRPEGHLQEDGSGAPVSAPSNMQATDGDFDIVAGDNGVGIRWRILARNLGFANPAIDMLEMDNKPYGMSHVIFQMLIKWRQRNGKAATRDALIAKLRASNEGMVADLVQENHT
ncbi:ankyrin-3-like [Ptychodera flava]|uniref:ankyrin-3-like n=1 Tax=Ptychodera flava TaxID=63121 RepID=UPI00396AB0E1